MSNMFLEGLFAPVTEEITAHDLPVTGTIPPELSGRYLRIGPNPLGSEDASTYHWFGGEGMVHGVRIRDGRAEWYRNRWVRSRDVAAKLGEEWPGGPAVENFDLAPNTHVRGHAGRTFALVEGGFRPYELTYDLDTVGACDFDGTLPGGYSAHSMRDPATGDLHAIAYFFGWEYVQHIVLNAAGRVTRTVNIPVEDGPMIHDLALTERYVVIYDLPVTFSMERAEAGVSVPYAWNDAHPARVGLLPRNGTAEQVRWFEIDPCWVFHTLNAHEDGDRVVIDLVKYPKLMVGGHLAGPTPVLDRWTLDTTSGKVLQETLDDTPQEFPRIDERLTGQRHRYGYTVTSSDFFGSGRAGEALEKHDYLTGRRERHDLPGGCGVGEAVFIPTAPDAAEDDGYLMAFAHDPGRSATDLVILSAQDFTARPLATVHLPVRVPIGFHGSWVPDTV
ncbi:carotenoid oxygenase family protein [Actinomadura flavalba]|uniref:carotenoid oxygenase family protein n=1 Tax=Actinomadura flavalba TaxID=1120938 RepID=UPI00037750C7|nr:carotenoid oxygenase family protein [Actinomadura flavalba]